MNKTIHDMLRKWVTRGYTDPEIIKNAPTTCPPDEIQYELKQIRHQLTLPHPHTTHPFD